MSETTTSIVSLEKGIQLLHEAQHISEFESFLEKNKPSGNPEIDRPFALWARESYKPEDCSRITLGDIAIPNYEEKKGLIVRMNGDLDGYPVLFPFTDGDFQKFILLASSWEYWVPIATKDMLEIPLRYRDLVVRGHVQNFLENNK